MVVMTRVIHRHSGSSYYKPSDTSRKPYSKQIYIAPCHRQRIREHTTEATATAILRFFPLIIICCNPLLCLECNGIAWMCWQATTDDVRGRRVCLDSRVQSSRCAQLYRGMKLWTLIGCLLILLPRESR